MDAESLREILKLKEENTLLKRGIKDAVLVLHKQERHPIMSYDIEELSCLFLEIKSILLLINKE